MRETERLRRGERWLSWVRLGAVPFAVFQTAVTVAYPHGREAWAWGTTGALAVGAVLFAVLGRRVATSRGLARLGLAALAFDFAIVSSFILDFSFERASPVRQVLIVVLIEAAFRYGIAGGVGLVVASAPVLAGFEWLRHVHFEERYEYESVTLQLGLQLIVALLVGWLVRELQEGAARAEERAVEAEALRDELGRRSDVLDAANRCARALASSLDLDEAFGAFIRELRGLLAFDRTAIVLADEGRAQVIATAGDAADEMLPPGTMLRGGALIEEVMRSGETAYREDMRDRRYPEEVDLVAHGLRARVVAPLLVGVRPIGMLAVLRREPGSFAPDEIELVSVLGRLVATAVQNIRAYEAERRTVEELRRLSALRADFVSLVSHELRSPMATVIGAARTLEQRWRELAPEQRTSFLALIANETSRLAALVGDVLDTSQIEAGTFSYAFTDVDVGELVRETVSAFGVGQDEVELVAVAPGSLPAVRGDRERLRQVLTNLVENAVKYSEAGGRVEVAARHEDGRVRVSVSDDGPGIAREHQRLIFEKFGRTRSTGAGKPGTGLGLFIARSIVEAHGGSLGVRSAPGEGATFTLELPVEAA